MTRPAPRRTRADLKPHQNRRPEEAADLVPPQDVIVSLNPGPCRPWRTGARPVDPARYQVLSAYKTPLAPTWLPLASARRLARAAAAPGPRMIGKAIDAFVVDERGRTVFVALANRPDRLGDGTFFGMSETW